MMARKEKQGNKKQETQQTNNKMPNINLSLSMSILKISYINALPKNQGFTEWMFKKDPTIYCLQEIHIKHKLIKVLKCYHAKINNKSRNSFINFC